MQLTFDRVVLERAALFAFEQLHFYIDRKKRLVYHHFEDFTEGENPKCFL